jgi:hypothetical protein
MTAQGQIDFQSLVFPVIDERRLWISLHAREFFRTFMQDALTSIGGQRMMRPFARELGERDSRAILRSVRNCIHQPPLFAFLTGRARAFTPCTLSTTIDLVGVSFGCLVWVS